MRDAGMLHPRHFFFPRHFFLQRCKVTGELCNCRRNIKCLGKCGSKKHFFCAWECADTKNTSLPGTFSGHFESAWDSADATNTSFPGTSYGKSAGENAEAKNTFLPGTFLLKY